MTCGKLSAMLGGAGVPWVGTGCLGRSFGRPPTVEPAEVEEEPAEGEEEPTEGGEESSVVRISTLPGLVTVLAVGESDVVVGRLLLAGGPTCLCPLATSVASPLALGRS